MTKDLQIGIPSPCSENWGEMSPEANGRFCSSCQKTVLDFTLMDDKEVLRWLASYQGSACGRFRPDQLNRPMSIPPEKKSRWRYWQYLVAGLLFSTEVSAQTKPAATPMHQHVSPNTILEKTNVYKPVEINVNHIPASNEIDMAPVTTIQAIAGGLVVGIRIRRNPIADPISMVKDTLAAIGVTKKALTIYPNPATRGNAITIAANLEQAGTYTIQLFNISGTLLQTTEVNDAPKNPKFSINIPANLTPGTYIVRLSHPGLTKCYTQEIVVL